MSTSADRYSTIQSTIPPHQPRARNDERSSRLERPFIVTPDGRAARKRRCTTRASRSFCHFERPRRGTARQWSNCDGVVPRAHEDVLRWEGRRSRNRTLSMDARDVCGSRRAGRLSRHDAWRGSRDPRCDNEDTGLGRRTAAEANRARSQPVPASLTIGFVIVPEGDFHPGR
jgi:hypothetical protein